MNDQIEAIVRTLKHAPYETPEAMEDLIRKCMKSLYIAAKHDMLEIVRNAIFDGSGQENFNVNYLVGIYQALKKKIHEEEIEENRG